MTPSPSPSPPPPDPTALPCPTCGYDLRHLDSTTCPECGQPFDPHALRQAVANQHPFLFEHHRGPRAFIKTALAALTPGFWRSVKPTHAPVRRRIVLYWVIAMAISLHVLAVEYAAAMIDVIRLNRPRYPRLSYSQLLVSQGPWTARTFGAVLKYDETFQGLWFVTIANLAWPWLTFVGLEILSRPLSASSSDDRLRASLYSADASAWVAPAFSSLLIAYYLGNGGPFSGPALLKRPLLIATAICYAWNLFRLWHACRHYLRLNHPTVSLLLSQLMSAIIAPMAAFLVPIVLIDRLVRSRRPGTPALAPPPLPSPGLAGQDLP